MNSHEVFIHIHQGCFAGTGAIVRLPQCQWSKPDGYGKISQCITTTKHSKAKTVCIFLGIYCKSALYCCIDTLCNMPYLNYISYVSWGIVGKYVNLDILGRFEIRISEFWWHFIFRVRIQSFQGIFCVIERVAVRWVGYVNCIAFTRIYIILRSLWYVVILQKSIPYFAFYEEW